jgi:hypothetical protein
MGCRIDMNLVGLGRIADSTNWNSIQGSRTRVFKVTLLKSKIEQIDVWKSQKKESFYNLHRQLWQELRYNILTYIFLPAAKKKKKNQGPHTHFNPRFHLLQKHKQLIMAFSPTQRFSDRRPSFLWYYTDSVISVLKLLFYVSNLQVLTETEEVMKTHLCYADIIRINSPICLDCIQRFSGCSGDKFNLSADTPLLAIRKYNKRSNW